MNGRKAKSLRRLAERFSKGWPAVSYERQMLTGSIIVRAETTRRVYLSLKRREAFRRGAKVTA